MSLKPTRHHWRYYRTDCVEFRERRQRPRAGRWMRTCLRCHRTENDEGKRLLAMTDAAFRECVA